VVRNLDNLVEMEVTINGKGYVFRGQSSGVTGKVFQACGVSPCRRFCAHAEPSFGSAQGERKRVTTPF